MFNLICTNLHIYITSVNIKPIRVKEKDNW